MFAEDFGNVPLPLRKEIADKLIKICKQALYGHNMETKVDTTVRDSFQLEPSCIKIKNPEFNKGLDKLLKIVAKGLGLNCDIEAKLYKLLVFKPGGHFKKHKDTEKEKNMFGTLIIQLPSDHEGGELVIYNKDSTKSIHDFGNKTCKSPYSVHFAAHFADFEHEILKIKSGYRLTLVYSLCWPNGNNQFNNKNEDSNDELMITCLEYLNEKDYKLAFLLDHEYTDSSLSQNEIKALKGIDHDRYNFLKLANNKLSSEKQLSFYIVNASLVVDSYDASEVKNGKYLDSRTYFEPNTSLEEKFWEENERKERIEKWYDEKGAPSLQNSKVDLNFFTRIIVPNSSQNIFTGMTDTKLWGGLRKVEIEGYTGNEGPKIYL